MTKQTAFLIWLYERECGLSHDSCELERGECEFIREKFIDVFDLDDEIEFHLKNEKD